MEMQAPGRLETIFSKREIRKELWRALPVWFFYLEALGVFHFEMGNVDPILYKELGYRPFHFAATAILPLSLVLGYYLVRIYRSERLSHKVYHALVIPSLLTVPFVLVYLLYTHAPGVRMVLSQDLLRRLFEFAQLIWILLFLVHAYFYRGFHKFITFYVVGFVYGLLLENTGIILGFFFEADYLFYLWRLPAPVVTMMGWCLVFYCCIWLADYFRGQIPWFAKSPLRSALLTTAIALFLDFQIDPLASLSGVFWRWNALLPGWFLNVPFCNFAAWFGAFMPFAWAYFYLEKREDLTVIQKNWKLFVHIPLIALIAGMLWLALMTIFEGGFSGPTYEILNAFFDKLIPYPT